MKHYVEIIINGERIDVTSEESLGIRITNKLFEPTKFTTKQATFSYSFEVPSTDRNNRIFGYGNVLSQENKFRTRYNCEVYSDGDLLFEGSAIVREFKDNKYTLNLVNIKVDALSDIFGEAKLTDIPWYVDFSGATTINSVNADESTKYFFPLVSYGVFKKVPYYSDEIANDYTSKFSLDSYNRWWNESFYPSMNVMETMKRAFEWKGYKVGGTAFQDPYISNIYASCNLADDQQPIYNLGNPMFGAVDISMQYTTNADDAYSQDLNYQYFQLTELQNIFRTKKSFAEDYNFKFINTYDLMGSGATITVNEDTYMYDPEEKCVVIPADGFYEIQLTTESTLNTSSLDNVMQLRLTGFQQDIVEDEFTIQGNLEETMPIEIHLVRNYDDNIELIKGKYNKRYTNGDPTDQLPTNVMEWQTCYPHEKLYNSICPTKYDSDLTSNESNKTPTKNNGKMPRPAINEDVNIEYEPSLLGYVYKDNEIMAYDQAISSSFICGTSSLARTNAVMKNGRSWSRSSTIQNESLYVNSGYYKHGELGGVESWVDTNFNVNDLRMSPISNVDESSNSMTSNLTCVVKLNRNDIIKLFVVHRGYQDIDGNELYYSTTSNVRLKMRAVSPRKYPDFVSSAKYGMVSEFPAQLNLSNFTNQETTIDSWIENVKKAFNLDIIQTGNLIEINTQKGINKDINYAIDIDDRVSKSDVKTSYISYPRTMAVKWRVDTEEWGFEKSVPKDKINLDDWFNYGDSGYTVIQLSDDSYETTDEQTQVGFSFTWYDGFKWFEVYQNGNEAESGKTLVIPVIEKSEYMADGYGYDEAMKHDGYSMAQRFWYRGEQGDEYVWLASHMREQVYITLPKATFNGFHLSYKDNEMSLLTEYFNCKPLLSSNYVEVDVYLTPQEYNLLKDGVKVHFDKDLYYVSEISGYAPDGSQPTTLKLIKQV